MGKSTKKSEKKSPTSKTKPKTYGWGIDPEKYAAARKPKPAAH